MEKFWMFVAWRLPRKLMYWTTVRASVEASTGEWSTQVVPDLLVMDVLKRLA
jgi:hypothetical protein